MVVDQVSAKRRVANERPVILGLVLVAVVAILLFILERGRTPDEDQVERGLFLVTDLLEAVSVVYVWRLCRRFAPGERAGQAWWLIAASMIVRLVAEARRATIWFHWVEGWREWPLLYDVYVSGLRYLYTLSELLLVAALVLAVRNFKTSGLPFSTRGRDWVYIALLCLLPVPVVIFRDNLALTPLGGYSHEIWRIVAAILGSIIAALCIVVRRYAIDLRGGLLAGVWNAVVLAGIARTASFLALALFLARWLWLGQFLEQLLLWVFSGAWLVALLREGALLPARARAFEPAAPVPSAP